MGEHSGLKIIKYVCIALVAFIVLFQFYQYFYNPVTTGSVIHYETYDGIDITAVAIRDEEILATKKSGVISYNLPDGGKIEKEGSVATVYSSEEDVNAALRKTELENLIKDLEEIEGYNDSAAVDIDMLDSKIDDALYDLIGQTSSGQISSVTADSELLKLINRRQIVTGTSKGFGKLISSYKSELEALEELSVGSSSDITTEKSGYFVSVVDGYEDVLKGEDIENLTVDTLNSIKPVEHKGSKRVVGKIVSDYEWYLAASLSLDDSLKLTEGEEMVLYTNFDSAKELPVTVKKINKGSSGDRALVIFSCTYMNSDLATMRTQDMTIVLKAYSGLQVNSKAVRFVDKQMGVYVLSGSVINFVPVKVVYSTDSYYICEAGTTGVRLKLYDEVIIKGKNLYDGKVIS